MSYPQTRLRRLRKSENMRRLVRETSLAVDDFVYPLFVCPGRDVKKPVESMQDCFHYSVDLIAEQSRQIADLGIPAVLLFGVPEKKDQQGSQAWSEHGVVQRAIREIKQAADELVVITDVCLCAYTTSGHCGVIKNERVDNDTTCELLAKTALSHAQAGADIVAPSDMMDGRVLSIRQCLEHNGFEETAIMAYSAKYASSFYGPFRDVADSAPAFGDRKSYQMDPAAGRQAIQEIDLDIEEGADIVMVKPALLYLDIIYRARRRFDCPIAAYNVSGEYMMLNAAARAGSFERQPAILEMLQSIKRAGTDIIITYFAKEAAKLIRR